MHPPVVRILHGATKIIRNRFKINRGFVESYMLPLKCTAVQPADGEKICIIVTPSQTHHVRHVSFKLNLAERENDRRRASETVREGANGIEV